MEPALDLKHSKYFFISSFLVVIAASVFLAWSFIGAILGGVVLAYLFSPLYNKLVSFFKNETVSAFITSFIVLALITIPLIFAGNAILNEATTFFYNVRNIDYTKIGEEYIEKFIGKPVNENIDIAKFIEDGLHKLSLSLLQNVDNFILSLPKMILSLFVMFFIMYYSLKDGKRLLFSLKEALPLKREYKENIANRFNDTIYATMYGVVVTAIVQGGIGALGFFIFGVSSPILWGIVMIILAMIPFVGAAFIWFPAALIKLASGDTLNGIGLLLYGIFIVSTIDNIIKPKIIGRRSKVHPALILIGVLGGLKLFGIIGIIIGPLLLAVLTVFFEIYINEAYES